MSPTKRRDDIRMCIDRFVPDDQRAAADRARCPNDRTT